MLFQAVPANHPDTRITSTTKQHDTSLNLDYAVGAMARIELSTGYHRDNIERLGSSQRLADTTDSYIQLNPALYFLKNSFFRIPLTYQKREWARSSPNSIAV